MMAMKADTGPDYLCFTSTGNSTVGIRSNNNSGWLYPNLEYSFDKETWVVWDYSAISLADGNKVYLRGDNTTFCYLNNNAPWEYYTFVMTGSVAASGSVMSLLDSMVASKTISATYAFYYLFNGCTALTSAPALPATTLATRCYCNMFYGCTALTSAPALPATTLATYCYYGMFQGCTSLTSAPALPATTLDTYCYGHMFRGCTSLANAPALPATTLATYCYQWMFYGCTSLTSAPALPATTLAAQCYYYMFYNCKKLQAAPHLPAATLVSSCYYRMFYGCTLLKSISVGATSWNTSYTSGWVDGVASSGTFRKPSGTSIATGTSGIPRNWTVVNV